MSAQQQGHDATQANPLASRFERDHDSPGLMLWRVTNHWQALMRATLAPFELTHVQFVLLAGLTWAGEPLSQIELAGRMRVDAMMTSQVVRALEGKGLVERRAHPSDRRARLLRATETGAALAKRANVAVERADAEFFGQSAELAAPLAAHLAALDAGSAGRN